MEVVKYLENENDSHMARVKHLQKEDDYIYEMTSIPEDKLFYVCFDACCHGF